MNYKKKPLDWSINESGIGYGLQDSFKTDPVLVQPVTFNPNVTYGAMTDVEGNIYKTVQIGNQVWMAENLRTTKFRNGDPIPNVSDDNTWSNLSTAAFCWYGNSPAPVKSTYGALYNWYAVHDSRKIAPEGWHVATRDDWSILDNLYWTNGGVLKETGLNHWSTPNTGATNQLGFTGIPGGYRNQLGTFTQFSFLL